MKIGVSIWRVLCKETKLKLLQNAMLESKGRFETPTSKDASPNPCGLTGGILE
ncbi:hypothetical protein [Bacillus cereus]|uniref:hypothetical protein n=1 Tax=Bacillus cereus TaxID=1396 RepID=UPI0015968467|nr:hypothetical protein [Bacillus cereus]